MSYLRTLSAWLPAMASRPISEIEQEIVDELDFHLSLRTEEHMSHGMSPDAARAAALAQFGDFATVHQRCRRALLGARIMGQRLQMILSAVLLAAVVFLAYQFFSNQRANQLAIDNMAAALKQLAPAAVAQAADKNAAIEAAPAAAITGDKSYPIELKADSVREFRSLAVKFGDLSLSGENITVVPISTAVGVTGAVLLGNGTYSFAGAPGKDFSGHFRSVMLRFHPQDADKVIKLTEGAPLADKGAVEMARAMLGVVFRHCYHAGQEALIPAERAIAADIFSREVGDVLVSCDDTTSIIYDFSSRKKLFPEK